MTEQEQRRSLMEMNTEEFNTMREMLTMIEIKIMQLDPLKQRVFYMPVRSVIFEAWSDACNPDDTFLFPKEK